MNLIYLTLYKDPTIDVVKPDLAGTVKILNPAKNATVPLCYFRNGLKYNLKYKDYKNSVSRDLNPKNQWDKTSWLGFIYIMQFTASYYVPQDRKYLTS